MQVTQRSVWKTPHCNSCWASSSGQEVIKKLSFYIIVGFCTGKGYQLHWFIYHWKIIKGSKIQQCLGELRLDIAAADYEWKSEE